MRNRNQKAARTALFLSLAACMGMGTHSQAFATTAQDESEARTGLIKGSRAGMLIRSYNHTQTSPGSPTSKASMLGAETWLESGFTPGFLGLGFDAAYFSALKISANQHAGNMARVRQDGSGWKERGWAYFGGANIKARLPGTEVRYGIFKPDIDYIVALENRALPSSYRGGTFLNESVPGLKIQAATFDRTIPRGHTSMRKIRSAMGGVPFDRLTSVSAGYDFNRNTHASLSTAHTTNLWNKFHLVAQHSLGDADTFKLTGRLDFYNLRSTGRELGGPMNNNTIGVQFTGQHKAHRVLLSYQVVASNQYFDYIGESAGVYTATSYYAPKEQSLQLYYALDMGRYGIPGLSLRGWGAVGWGADGSAMAKRYGADTRLGRRYMANGKPIHGGHYEYAFSPAYTVQSGKLKNTKVTVSLLRHVGSKYYPDDTANLARVIVNIPITFL